MNKAKPAKPTKTTAKTDKKPDVEMSADDLKKVSGGALVDYFGRKAG